MAPGGVRFGRSNSSSRSTSASKTISSCFIRCSTNRVFQFILLFALGIVLLHTLSVLQQGHYLVEQQQDAFAAQHKNAFRLDQQLWGSGSRSSNKKGPSGASSVGIIDATDAAATTKTKTTHTHTAILQNVKILIAIASYDWQQIPHLEETLDGYHELCVAGAAQVHVQVHTTVMYPVALLDLYQTRFPCANFRLMFVIKNKALRLHLADEHRKLFYEEINNYDLFIYTEDDIRLTPTNVATYWQQTNLLKQWPNIDYTLYNVGVVRYEYNFPSVIIDDKTRHATENVTRVYWEHSHTLIQQQQQQQQQQEQSSSSFNIVPGAVRPVDSLNAQQQQQQYHDHYVHMHNHHQGMYLATREHLLKWKELPMCRFDVVTNRPGTEKQPLIGTQRVWMSSYQLYEPKYCNIQQVLPISKFGALTVHHLPNKNYRRVGLRVTESSSNNNNNNNSPTNATINQGSPKLVKALQLHLDMKRQWPSEPKRRTYNGIQVIDEVTQDRDTLLDQRLSAFRQYIQRGRVLSDQDMQDIELLPP